MQMATMAALVALVMGTVTAAGGGLPMLGADTARAWQSQVKTFEARWRRQNAEGGPFLSLDQPAHHEERRAVLAGDTWVRPGTTGSEAAAVPGARLHHWRGAVFLADTSVDRLLAALEAQPPAQPDVLRSRVLSRGAEGMHVYLRLRRQQVVTVVYDTEHVVRFDRQAPGRATSTSRAVRITEVEAPGTAAERALNDHEDRDFLWRLHAYWRYADVPGGVLVECESLSLSRSVPFGLGIVANPLIARTAESSMRAALLALRGVPRSTVDSRRGRAVGPPSLAP